MLLGLGLLALAGCIVDPDPVDDFKKDIEEALELMAAEQAARLAEMDAREAARRAEMEEIKARLTDMPEAEIAEAENDCNDGYSRKRTVLCDALVERRDLVTIAMVKFERLKLARHPLPAIHPKERQNETRQSSCLWDNSLTG